MRVITFSRVFPAKHPRKGEPTYFIEKILAGLDDLKMMWTSVLDIAGLVDREKFVNCDEPKWHTIRVGNRWKVGDSFSPRVWSEWPYRSKQIIIAPPIKIKKIWHISFDQFSVPAINGVHLFDEYNSQNWDFDLMAKNDGLTPSDAIGWFKPYKETVGQILCWNDNVEYV